MKRYRLKKKYKNALICLFGIACGVALMFGVLGVYNARVNSIKDKTPGSVPLKEIFKK